MIIFRTCFCLQKWPIKRQYFNWNIEIVHYDCLLKQPLNNCRLPRKVRRARPDDHFRASFIDVPPFVSRLSTLIWCFFCALFKYDKRAGMLMLRARPHGMSTLNCVLTPHCVGARPFREFIQMLVDVNMFLLFIRFIRILFAVVFEVLPRFFS